MRRFGSTRTGNGRAVAHASVPRFGEADSLRQVLDELDGHAQHEARTLARPVAVRREAAVHLLRGVGAVVQSEAVARLLGREAVTEDLRQILGLDAGAVVPHLDPHAAFDLGDRHHELPIGPHHVLERVLRVGDQVHEDLHDLMPIDEHGRQLLVAPNDLDVAVA